MTKKTPPNSGKPWTPTQVKDLKDLAKHNTPTPLIAYKLQRSEPSVRAKAAEKNVSLKPTNKPTYGSPPKKRS